MERAATNTSKLRSKQEQDCTINRLPSMAHLISLFLRGTISVFPRINLKVEGMTKHKGIYVTPSHTKKVFANIKECGMGKGIILVSGHTLFDNKDGSSSEIWVESRRKQRKDSGRTEPIPDEATNKEHVSTPSYDPSQKKAMTVQAKEIASLKKREDVSKQGRKIADLDDDDEAKDKELEEEEKACIDKKEEESTIAFFNVMK
ncbi:hypothetical protein Tco_0127433 [Tanacetum coccineum]